MDNLPLEIISEIAKCLQEIGGATHRLSTYAAISPAWQSAIEQLTFSSLKINLEEIDTFKRYISPPNASRAHRFTWLNIDLASGSSNDAHIDTDAISKGISTLFTALADGNSQGNNSPPLKLTFSMTHFGDYEAFDIIIPESVPSLPQVDMFGYDAVSDHSALKVAFVKEIMKRLPRTSRVRFRFLDLIEWGARRRRVVRQSMCCIVSYQTFVLTACRVL